MEIQDGLPKHRLSDYSVLSANYKIVLMLLKDAFPQRLMH